MIRALEIDEKSLGPNHPDVARDLNNLALLYRATNRLSEAEPLARRALNIILMFNQTTGYEYPHQQDVIANYYGILKEMNLSEQQIHQKIDEIKSSSTATPTPKKTP